MSYTIDTIEYQKHTIKVWDDPLASEWSYGDLKNGVDGLLLVSFAQFHTIGFGYDRAEKYLYEKIKKLSARQIFARMSEEAKESTRENLSYISYNDVIDFIEAADFDDWFDGMTQEDILTELCIITKTDYYSFAIHGYSQGEYGECMLIDNGEFKDFQKQAKAYKNYVEKCFFGGFVGYTVDGPHYSNSCDGFADVEDAISEAKSQIDYAIEQAEKKRQAKLKEQIRHHAPLTARV